MATTSDSWVGTSLEQHATPWQGNDEQLIDHGLPSSREPRRGLGRLVVLAALAGCVLWLVWPGSARPTPSPALGGLDLVPGDALAYVSVRVSDLWNGPTLKGDQSLDWTFLTIFGFVPDEVERVTVVLSDLPPARPVGIDPEMWAMVETMSPFSADTLQQDLAPRGPARHYRGHQYFPLDRRFYPEGYLHILNDRMYVLATPRGITRYLDHLMMVQSAGPVQAVAAGMEKKHAVLGVRLSDSARKRIEALVPELEILLRVREARLWLDDAASQFLLHGQLTFADGAQAQKAGILFKTALQEVHRELNRMMDAARRSKQIASSVMPRLQLLHATLRRFTIQEKGNELVMDLGAARGGEAFRANTDILQRQLDIARYRVNALQKLKRIVAAFQAYERDHKGFPPAVTQGGLSWRVALLPYLGEKKLYAQFHLDEPWDSAHNLRFAKNVPWVYRPPFKPRDPGGTQVQVFVGPGAPFDGHRSPRLADFTDGTSRTLLVVEGGWPVTWTQPADLRFQPDRLPRLTGPLPGKFLAAFADGSVRYVPTSLNATELSALITPAGGEDVDPP
jgi:hypothetical protein